MSVLKRSRPWVTKIAAGGLLLLLIYIAWWLSPLNGIFKVAVSATRTNEVAQAIAIYENDLGTYPTFEHEELYKELTGKNPRLQTYLAPSDSERKRELYLDAWDVPLHFSENPTEYIVISAGRDKVFRTKDDIINRKRK